MKPCAKCGGRHATAEHIPAGSGYRMARQSVLRGGRIGGAVKARGRIQAKWKREAEAERKRSKTK